MYCLWQAASTASYLKALSLLLVLASGTVYAHEHHTDLIPEGDVVSPDPIDGILWAHILIQSLAWGIIFPTGMVLGLVHSRWHIPTQILGVIGAIIGHFLGHAHKGRQFGPNVHSKFAPVVEIVLAAQIALGVYLRLHINRGFWGRIRNILRFDHSLIGKSLPIVAWIQMLFGGITALGFCQGDHLGQCLAHFIMGSAFIAYGIVLTIMLLVGQPWLLRHGRSQEFYDSAVIAAWGCVNTFTEHRWGGPWVRNDLQHTSMGIVWWAAGLVGMWLSRSRKGKPKRNLIPGIVILLTGWAMSAHPQELMISTMVHSMFGYTLMLAGLTRIIEVSFVLRDRACVSRDGSDPHSFQYLPAFLLFASGFLFMGATEEQMALLSAAGVTHVSYILILYSFAFLLFLFVNVLLHIYATRSKPASSILPNISDPEQGTSSRRRKPNAVMTSGTYTHENGHVVPSAEVRQVHDAQEFELDVLISDDEDQEPGTVKGRQEADLIDDMHEEDESEGSNGKMRTSLG